MLYFPYCVVFYLIYFLYKELRNRINPETTLKKIRFDAMTQLQKENKKMKRHSYMQNNIFEYKDDNKKFSLEVQYKSNQNWHQLILENIKYLFEIGFRLLSKNEINSFLHTLSIKT
jgi:hypothetical protein